MTIKIILINIALLFFGALFFLQQESWIIINWPSLSPSQTKLHSHIQQTQEVPLWIWNKDTFKQEMSEIILSNDHAQIIKQIVNNFFTACLETNSVDQQIIVQSVIVSNSGQEAFISLNQNPFNLQSSTFAKLMLMQSLLKTLQCTKSNITHIRLLVQHQPLTDQHLNFDISWPIQGYI